MIAEIPVQMRGITVQFPGVLANDHIDLDLRSGEVHGLLGENGAGKTTLMNVLFGLYKPDEGEILINGQPVHIQSPANAIALGIGMVHQHFRLVQPFTVTENIILGLDEGDFFLDMSKAARKVAKVAEQYSLKIDPMARIQQLSVGEQQRVEILNSLYRGANVLILDEPTAVLTPQEADDLAVVLRNMANQGKVIVFISHKLDEVLKVTDCVTVLRAGRVVFSSLTQDTDKNHLAREMIGHEITALKINEVASVMALAGARSESAPATHLAHSDTDAASMQVALEVENLHVNDDRGLPAVQGMSLNVHAGEILGVAGVDGNGQRELVEALTGLRAIESGKVRMNGVDTNGWTPRDYIQHNVAYITDDRHGEGLILNFNLARNAGLKIFERKPFSQRWLLNFAALNQFTKNLLKVFDVRAPSPQVRASTLSGGNQQKLILARELSQNPPLIIASKPTRGLDIGAAAYIHQKLADERARGAAILMVSADLDELLTLSDCIVVMFEGQGMGELAAEEADPETLGLMMAGTPLTSIEASQEKPK